MNLIGEHTDYNGGYVLPTAIPQRTRVELAPRADRTIRVWSANVPAPDRPKVACQPDPPLAVLRNRPVEIGYEAIAHQHQRIEHHSNEQKQPNTFLTRALLSIHYLAPRKRKRALRTWIAVLV